MISEDKPYVLIETRESTDGLDVLVEKSHSGKKLYLTGIFTQAERVNGNRRIYPKSVMERAVDEYTEKFIKRKQAIGELNHPKDRLEPDPSRACVFIESLEWQGNDVIGRAVVPETTMGKEVKALMEAGWVPGVSSRASGSLKKRKDGILEVQNDLRFYAIIDVVHNPSAPDAYVSGIYESTETGLILVTEQDFDDTKYKRVESEGLMKFARRLVIESRRL